MKQWISSSSSLHTHVGTVFFISFLLFGSHSPFLSGITPFPLALVFNQLIAACAMISHWEGKTREEWVRAISAVFLFLGTRRNGREAAQNTGITMKKIPLQFSPSSLGMLLYRRWLLRDHFPHKKSKKYPPLPLFILSWEVIFSSSKGVGGRT